MTTGDLIFARSVSSPLMLGTDGDGAPSLPRKVDFDKQREFYKRQAELANRLRQLQGNVTGSSNS